MEYYLAITKNKIMPFAATWIEIKINIACYHLYNESLKKYSKVVARTKKKAESEIQRINKWLPVVRGREEQYRSR